MDTITDEDIIEENITDAQLENLDLALVLIPLPTQPNAKKSGLKVVEEFEKGDFKVTVYRYKVTNHGYTLTPLQNTEG